MLDTKSNQNAGQKKYGHISDKLHAIALKLGPDAKMPTVLQLRDTFGVSLTTLNSALRELESKKVICRKPGIGIYVASEIRKPICVIADMNAFTSTSPFWNILLEAVRKRTHEWNDTVRFHIAFGNKDTADSLEGSLLNDIEEGRIQGILGIGLSHTAMKQLIALDVPHVSYAGSGYCTVGHDTEALVSGSVAALAAQGCRRIHFWNPVRFFGGSGGRQYMRKVLAEEESYFQKAIKKHGLVYTPNAALNRPFQFARIEAGGPIESFIEQGMRIARETYAAPPLERPDGLVIADDMMTLGGLTTLQKMGVRIGEEVRVATHANAGSYVLMGYEDIVTRLEFDPAEIVAQMFAILEDWMRGEKPAECFRYVQPHLRQENAAHQIVVRREIHADGLL